MYKINDYVIYKKDVCKIKDIKNNKMNGKDYYILVPIDDESLKINVPIDNEIGLLKNIISKQEAEDLINNILNIDIIENIQERDIEKTYKELLYNGNHIDLIKIIKTSYLRNDNRIKNNKKLSEKDTNYFNLAEKYLYNELSLSLDMSFDETKNYIINKLNQLCK